MSNSRRPTGPSGNARSPAATRSGRAGAVVGAVGGGIARFARRKPGVVAGILAVLGCGSAVAWNALTQQPGRHPAPLFGRSGTAVEPPRRPDLAATPPPAAPIPVRRPEASAFQQAPTPNQIPPAESPRSTPSDPIGALIRTGEVQSGARPVGASDSQRVVSAQRALTKLGYGPLKPDGQLGTTTRQAVEAFERDQKLPPTGALSVRTARQLASVSGIAIE